MEIWLFCLLFVKFHDEGKSALPSLDRAIQYEDAKMHCYECCLSANTSNDTSNTPLMGSQNIYLMQSLVIYLKYVYLLYCNKLWAKSPHIFGGHIKRRMMTTFQTSSYCWCKPCFWSATDIVTSKMYPKKQHLTSWPDVGLVSLVLSQELNPGHLGEKQVS